MDLRAGIFNLANYSKPENLQDQFFSFDIMGSEKESSDGMGAFPGMTVVITIYIEVQAYAN